MEPIETIPSFSSASNSEVSDWEENSMIRVILIIFLLIILIGALPTWPYSGGWGYYPSGGLGLVLLIIIILVLMGRF